MTENQGKEPTAFASRAMLNILQSGMHKCGIDYGNSASSGSQALIPLDTKKNFVHGIGQEYGLKTLLLLSYGVVDFVDSPIGKALLQYSDPSKLIEKWQRLERYIHSQHYIDATFLQNGVIQVSHLSNTNTPPMLEESLAVLGVLCALVYEVTKQSVYLCRSEHIDSVIFSYPEGSGQTVVPPCEQWYIHWQLPNQNSTQNTAFGADIINTAETGSCIVEQIRARILELGLLGASLKHTAHSLAVSVRTLQRRLSEANVKFSSLVQETRVKKASQLLLQGELCISEIGFVCGFSDQAHFSRVFKTWTGMSPKQYGIFRTI